MNFICERRKKLQEAREVGKKERKLKSSLESLGINPEEINARSLYMLVEMGFQKEHCALALKKCNNNISNAVSLILFLFSDKYS